MDEPLVLDVRPLTPERMSDLAMLFDQGGDPKWCSCMYYRRRGMDFSNSTAASNRAGLGSIAGDDPPPGLIGYRDGQAIGWVSLGPRSGYERLVHSRVLAPVDDRPVWSIVCFVVGRAFRRQGVAAALLDAAIAHAREHGAVALEAYPADIAPGTRIASANAYMGTLAMFERAGFTVVARRQMNASSPIRPIVRLELGGRH